MKTLCRSGGLETGSVKEELNGFHILDIPSSAFLSFRCWWSQASEEQWMFSSTLFRSSCACSMWLQSRLMSSSWSRSVRTMVGCCLDLLGLIQVLALVHRWPSWCVVQDHDELLTVVIWGHYLGSCACVHGPYCLEEVGRDAKGLQDFHHWVKCLFELDDEAQSCCQVVLNTGWYIQ